MKSYKEKLEILKSDINLRKKRISDDTLVGVQEVINKIKELIDNEVNMRAINLNKQCGLK